MNVGSLHFTEINWIYDMFVGVGCFPFILGHLFELTKVFIVSQSGMGVASFVSLCHYYFVLNVATIIF